MTTYRYKSDTAIKEAVTTFFTFGLVSATVTAATAAGILIAMRTFSNCDYIGYRAAVVLIPVVHLVTWVLVSGSMCLIFAAMTRDDPPPPLLADKPAKQRKLSFSRGSKKGFVTWEK